MGNLRVQIAALSGALACILEFVMEVYAASKNTGYHSMSQTISYLGNPISPTYHLIKIWNIVFAVLFIYFAWGFYTVFKKQGAIIKTAFVLLLIYGLAQGLGAGIFTMDALKTQNTWSNLWHNVFSIVGDIGMVLFPLVMARYFVKEARLFSQLISVGGIFFIALFLLAKFEAIQQIVNYKGLWQRIFQGFYYIYFLFIAYEMNYHNKRGFR